MSVTGGRPEFVLDAQGRETSMPLVTDSAPLREAVAALDALEERLLRLGPVVAQLDQAAGPVHEGPALHLQRLHVDGVQQRAALGLHLVRGLPRANDHLAHSAHRLAVGRHHRQRAEVVQDVLGGDGFLADAAFCEGDIFRD